MAVAYFMMHAAGKALGHAPKPTEHMIPITQQGRTGGCLLLGVLVHGFLRLRTLEHRCDDWQRKSCRDPPAASNASHPLRPEMNRFNRYRNTPARCDFRLDHFACCMGDNRLVSRRRGQGFRQGSAEQFSTPWRLGRYQIGRRARSKRLLFILSAKTKPRPCWSFSEIFGLTDWVRSLCDELAENGVIAIAPDLLGGQKFEDARWRAQSNVGTAAGTGESGSGCDIGLRAHENSGVQRHARGVRILLGRGCYVRVCE